MISNYIIEQIIESSNCYEVIKDFMVLKKSGSNWKGLSPFTNEKTPSFIVSSVKNIWKDFSSGNGGNVISYLMKAQSYTFIESINYLGNKYNIEVKSNHKSNTFELQELKSKKDNYKALGFSKRYFYNNLKQSKECKDYLLSRNFTPEIIKKFKIGYSLNSWDGFLKSALLNKFSCKVLEEVNLVSCSNRKYFDKFRGRLMFPISDVHNKVIGYGARILKESKEEAKYLNSSETKLYHKSFVLYGLNFAVQEIIRQDNCFIVEGYTDVISFHQKNVCNTVASCGTALTISQLKIIKRYTYNITFVFDGDKAGVKATFKSIDLALEIGMNVSVVKLKDIDPHDLAHSVKSLIVYLEDSSMDFLSYKCSFIENLKIDEKAKRINNVLESISKIEDSIKRNLYFVELQKKYNLDSYDSKKLEYKKPKKKAFKAISFKDSLSNNNNSNNLIEIIKNNNKLIIDNISVLDYIVLKIYELEEPYLNDFNLEFVKINNLVKDITKEEIIKEEIDLIFKSIKIDFINIKLMNITDENLNFVQDLICIKQTI